MVSAVAHFSRANMTWRYNLERVCPTRDPVDGFVRPRLGFRCSKIILYILTTCLCVDNLELDIFDTGCLQCHFITSVIIAVRIQTFSVY